jgi:phage terminase large subunit-like protein
MARANQSLAEIVAALPEVEQERALRDVNPEQLLWDWSFWGRPQQLTPPDAWDTWLVLAGRGFGKTRAGAEWVRSMACGETPEKPGKAKRIALIGETASDVRKVIVEGESGVLAVHPPAFRPEWQPSTRTLMWPNGAQAFTYNATEPDELRGPQFDAALCDELAKWRHARETWDQLAFALRLGVHPQVMITTTPRPIAVLKEIMADPRTVVTAGKTAENRANLAASFLTRVVGRYAGTRLGRQELDGEMVDEVKGALWTRALLEAKRVRAHPDLVRVVVAVDPSGTSGKGAGDDVGIVVAGLGVDGRWYVLADWTCNLSPEGWARRAIAAYHEFAADRIVAEGNFGGAMVEAVIRNADPTVSFKMVHASRGKVARAEPVAALYEQGRVSHVGMFAELEDQMCAMTPAGYEGEGRSPDRADALVWALTELSGKQSAEPRVRSL